MISYYTEQERQQATIHRQKIKKKLKFIGISLFIQIYPRENPTLTRALTNCNTSYTSIFSRCRSHLSFQFDGLN